MRIRKNAKLSTILQFSAPEWRLQTTHVCRLNQSPWDVITFSDDTYPAQSLNQFVGNDSFELNTSLGNSSGVVESVEWMMDCEDDNGMEMKTNDNGKEEEEDDEEATKIKKNKLCKGLNNKTSVSAKREAVMADRGTWPRRAKKGSSWNSSNPYEFYYYSGFGPLWGKRRADSHRNGGAGEAKIKNKSSKSNHVEGVNTQNTPPPPSLIDRREEFDFVEEEDDYEDDDDEQSYCNGGKKRVRKLVKARSLKSLM